MPDFVHASRTAWPAGRVTTAVEGFVPATPASWFARSVPHCAIVAGG